MMKILWIVRGIKNYRVPVYNSLALDEKITLSVIYNKQLTDNSIYDNLSKKIIQYQISKELIYGPKDNNHGFANRSFRATFVPGLYKTIRVIRPDVIIVEGFFQYSFYAFIYKIFNNKTKIVLSYERTKFTERNAQRIRVIYRKLILKLTHSIVCNGSLSREYLIGIGFNKPIYMGNMTVDVNLINKEVNKNKILNQVGNRKLTFTYIGLLTKRKGLFELFEVWKKFEELYSDEVVLNIVGSGDSAQQLKSYITKMSINSINFIGQVDYNQITNYLSNSDVLINPTLEDNWSLVVPEAMSAELPIITTMYNGLHPELVKESNGWVFDILSPEDTLNMLIKVYHKRNSLRVMGKSSFEIIKKYNPQLIAKNFLDASK